MRLSEAIQGLTDELRAGHESRHQAFEKRMEAETARRAEAAAAAEARAEFLDGLRATVGEMRASTASRIRELSGHRAKAHKTWANLAEFVRQRGARFPTAPPARPSVKRRGGRRSGH